MLSISEAPEVHRDSRERKRRNGIPVYSDVCKLLLPTIIRQDDEDFLSSERQMNSLPGLRKRPAKDPAGNKAAGFLHTHCIREEIAGLLEGKPRTA